ncbi:MAG: hypothetical protein PHQ35_09535 [Phycisphaerae bacterium]|nr:hypothetical protein [Phycisphaerae bacterium]MDD5239957.1 hypothetical protein [Candidatus Nanoarchaeia archaeon]
MKAILVLDMPKDCRECALSTSKDYGLDGKITWVCTAYSKRIDVTLCVTREQKHLQCPLLKEG